jgi:hypothetical protein
MLLVPSTLYLLASASDAATGFQFDVDKLLCLHMSYSKFSGGLCLCLAFIYRDQDLYPVWFFVEFSVTSSHRTRVAVCTLSLRCSWYLRFLSVVVAVSSFPELSQFLSCRFVILPRLWTCEIRCFVCSVN